MASGQTQYYGLSQWEAADKVERVDFNSDNAKIDGALRALAEQAGQKADRSAVDSLSNAVEQKADKTALSAAEGRIYDFYAPGEYAQEAPAEPWERLRVSVDYGTVYPTSMGLWALKDGVWYRVDEYYYDSRTEGRQKTDEEYVDALEHNGTTYMAFFPVVEEDSEDEENEEEYGLVILKSQMENGEEFLVTIDDEEEIDKVYDLFMEQILSDEE